MCCLFAAFFSLESVAAALGALLRINRCIQYSLCHCSLIRSSLHTACLFEQKKARLLVRDHRNMHAARSNLWRGCGHIFSSWPCHVLFIFQRLMSNLKALGAMKPCENPQLGGFGSATAVLCGLKQCAKWLATSNAAISHHVPHENCQNSQLASTLFPCFQLMLLICLLR